LKWAEWKDKYALDVKLVKYPVEQPVLQDSLRNRKRKKDENEEERP
jgi:hypothetical protein